jgi:hypothetical protein
MRPQGSIDMTGINDPWEEQRRNRSMRTNAHLYIRHDAHRFMPPGSPLYVGRDVVKYFWPERKDDRPPQGYDSKNSPELSAEIAELLRLKAELATLRTEIRFRRLLRTSKAFNPNQPRVTAGNPDGGQWTSENGQSNLTRVAQLGGTLTDAFGNPYYQPDGHHEMPKGVYEKWELSPETRQVFKDATTGSIPLRMRTTPDGVPLGNFWDGPNGAHRIYNNAVEELANRFLEANNIRPEQMTPDQARSLLKEIRESQDPRIRDFNNSMRLLRRIFRLRTGRGNE